jgi:hypothetical protein
MQFVINIKIEIKKKSKYERNSVNIEYRIQVHMTHFAQNIVRNELRKWRKLLLNHPVYVKWAPEQPQGE